MPRCAQGIAARWLLFMAALTTFLHLVKAADNFTDFDWLNATQLLEIFENENRTEGNSTEADVDALLENVNVNETPVENPKVDATPVEKINRNSEDDSPFEKLRQHRHYPRFVFMVVLLHVAVVGVCIIIYSLVYCKARTLRKHRRAEAQRCLRLTNLQSQHEPNSRDCPCHGCTVAREMLQGLVLQQFQELVEC